MSIYKLVTVHDWYDSSRITRIRCEYVSGNYFCHKSQMRDAMRRASVMPGSCLRCDLDTSINVVDDDGCIVDIIKGA